MRGVAAILLLASLSLADGSEWIDMVGRGAAARQNNSVGAPVVTYYGSGMNATNSSFITSAAVNLGVTNSWSVVAWVQLANSGGLDYNLFQFGQGFAPVGPSVIKLVLQSTVANSTYIYWSDSANTAFRYYTYPAVGTSLVHIAITWDGTTNILYTNGAVCSPASTPVNNAGTFANDTRKLFVGCGSNNDGATILDRVQGTIYQIAIYNYALAATAITAIATAHCTVPAGSPNHNYNTYVTGDPLSDTIGSVNLVATNITQVTTVVTNCP